MNVEWFKSKRRPPYSKELDNVSIPVLMYSPEMDIHTIGWFYFDSERWVHIADEDLEEDFIWTLLPRPEWPETNY